MNSLRKILIGILGLEGSYLLMSRIFILMVSCGLEKKKHPELYYLRKIIKPGFFCLDIGANMGYYTYFLSKYCGKDGKVFAVEPVPVFMKLLKRNIRRTGYNNIELMPYALGEKNQQVKMGIPAYDGIIHHGMTRVAHEENPVFVQYHNAEMKVPDELFKDLPRIDFIKCDVEGYEHHVFENMTTLIKKFSPIIQTELSNPEGGERVISLLQSLGYKGYRLDKYDQLIPIKNATGEQYSLDYYFLNM